MSKQFYVWKDRNCNGIDPEWVQLTGREYFRFIKDPANKGRCFVTLDNGGDSDAGVIYMEATPEVYRKWDVERQERKRKQTRDRGYCEYQLSLDELVDEDEELSLHEVVADDSAMFVERVLRDCELLALREVLLSLEPEELELLNALFFQNLDVKSEREIAMILNIPQKTMNNRKKKTFEKIKKFLAQNCKSVPSNKVEG